VVVKLTLAPTADEKADTVGYSAPHEVPRDDVKDVDLFDYVMLYVKELYEVKMKR
jgi:hypothetical protein